MSAWLLTIESPDGNWGSVRYTPGEERQEIDREMDRPPFSEAWYPTGTGAFKPSTLQFSFRIQGVRLVDADDGLVLFLTAAKGATRLTWGSRKRDVWGLTGPLTITPIFNGYRVECQFAAKGSEWTL
jgi:hypothetical protein